MFTVDQLIAHAVGDYVLQSEWMAMEKTKRSLPALVHCLFYLLPFLFITQNPATLAVIGDGTFTHSGMAPLLDAARDDIPIKVFILDNSIVAMTGGQPTMATDEQVVDLVAGLGVPRDRIRIISPTPQNKADNVRLIRKEIDRDGISVIIARRACVTYAKVIKQQRRQRRPAPA